MRYLALLALLTLAACAGKPAVPVCPPGDQSNACVDRDGSTGAGPNEPNDPPPELARRVR